MDYPWAVPGAKVVRVRSVARDEDATRHLGGVLPQFGVVYTIRAVKPAGYGGCKNTLLLLEEISNAHIQPEPFEPGFAVHHFRPLITQSDDIAFFARIAQDASHRISEDV